jgi:integrase
MTDELVIREVSNLAASTAWPPERNPYHVYLARLSQGSRPAMKGALESLAALASNGRLSAEAFPWHLLRYQHAQALRSRLTEEISTKSGRPLGPASINKALSALRGVLKEAWRLGLMSAEDLARATDLEAVRGSTVLKGRALSAHEVASLFHVCAVDNTAAGPRDAVILALGVAAGLRRAEMAALDFSDVDLETEVVRVQGKGQKIREVPVKNGALDALRAWIHHRGDRPGPLLSPVRKGGRVEMGRLAPQAIQRACEKRARQVGIPDFTPHDLRRTYISTLLDRGVDLAVASDLAGHSSPRTTKRYDRRGERARHQAAELVVVPYVWREQGVQQ